MGEASVIKQRASSRTGNQTMNILADMSVDGSDMINIRALTLCFGLVVGSSETLAKFSSSL